MASDSTNLDIQVNRTIDRLNHQRSQKRVLVLAAIVAGVVLLLGMTLAMYTSTPGEIPPERIGSETLGPLSK